MHGGHHFFAKTLGERPALVRAFLEKRAVQRATDLVGVSRFVADQTRELLSLGDRPIDIIPNGVDVERFQPGNATRESGLIVFVGTVAEKKGIGQLIGAMHDIVQAVPDGHLEVYGRDWMSGGQSLTKTLRRNISSDLSAHIRFKGHVPNDVLPQVLRRAAVAAYPSHMEAMPMTWLEGLASGCAVVAGRPGPGPEVIDHGVTGLLCDPHDPSDIAEKIVSVLKDERMRASLGSNARKSVLKRFALGVVVDANLEFYERCVARFRNA
jgi:glycosyltransferase involved in cell wall biosynthesis